MDALSVQNCKMEAIQIQPSQHLAWTSPLEIVGFGRNLSSSLSGSGKFVEQVMRKHGQGKLEADIETLTAPVCDRNDLKREGFTISVEVSEGMDFLYITLRV